jgi:hypothetical protein
MMDAAGSGRLSVAIAQRPCVPLRIVCAAEMALTFIDRSNIGRACECPQGLAGQIY